MAVNFKELEVFLKEELVDNSKLMIIDEIGRMELMSKYFYGKIQDYLNEPEKIIVASINEKPA